MCKKINVQLSKVGELEIGFINWPLYVVFHVSELVFLCAMVVPVDMVHLYAEF